jgi:tetratricopeptide (TPR) repeat protein
MLTLQCELARTVATEIQVKLTPRAKAQLTGMGAIHPDAYEAYLRGRTLLNRRTRATLQKSIDYFRQSIEHDPCFAIAYSGLAESYLVLQDFGYMAPRFAIRKARVAARRGLELGGMLAETHTSMGHAFFHEFNWRATERALKRAVELNPNYIDAHFYYSNYLVAMGRSEEAISEARSALALDPVSLPAGCNLAYVLVHAEQFQDAIDECSRVLEIDCNYARAYEDLGRAYEGQGRYSQAVASFDRAVAASGRGSLYIASLAHACALAGMKQKSLTLLRELEIQSKRRYVSPFFIALVKAGLGDIDQSLSWLNKAYRMRDHHLSWLTVNPRLRPLHSDRRFRVLRHCMRLSTG